MKIKELHLVYFSPTGTGKRNLEFAAENFSCETREHDITCNGKIYEFGSDDLVLFAAPVYGGRIPDLAKEHLSGFTGNNTPCILFSVYGNRAFDDALVEMQELTESSGFVTIAGLGVLGQHTFTDKVATGRPNSDDRKTIAEMMESVKSKLEGIADITRLDRLELPGKPDCKPYSRMSLSPKTNKNCSHCNRCLEVCPSHAISSEHFDVPDPDLCIGCLACVKVCPSDARHANSIKLAAIAKVLETACSKPRPIELYL